LVDRCGGWNGGKEWNIRASNLQNAYFLEEGNEDITRRA